MEINKFIRPRIAEFQDFVESKFRVSSMTNADLTDTWLLEELEVLEAPPIEELKGKDCFTLIFETEQHCPQGWYRVENTEGKVWQFMATPISAINGRNLSQVIVF